MTPRSAPNCPPHRTLCPPRGTVHFSNVCVYLPVEYIDIVVCFIQPSRLRAYIYWKSSFALWTEDRVFRVCSQRGIRGRKLSGISVQLGWRHARGPPSSCSKAPASLARTVDHPPYRMPLNEAHRWEPNPGIFPQKGQAMINLAPRTRAATKPALVPIDQIDFPTNARPTHAAKVSELVTSIRMLGLQSAPTVVERNGRYMLVSGCHRVEAMRVIGKDPIPVRIADFDEIEARLWTISENLHRNELSVVERANQVAEWVKLSEERAAAKAVPIVEASPTAAPSEVSRQVGEKPQGGRPEGGNRVCGA